MALSSVLQIVSACIVKFLGSGVSVHVTAGDYSKVSSPCFWTELFIYLCSKDDTSMHEEDHVIFMPFVFRLKIQVQAIR